MPQTRSNAFDQTVSNANLWVNDVARSLGTEDHRFAYRALRAWLHALRDRLTVEASAKFTAQLPEVLRGVFYEGWEPTRVPSKFGPDGYVVRFSHEAAVPADQVPATAGAVSRALADHLSPGLLAQTLAQLPAPLRDLVLGAGHQPAEVPAQKTVQRGATVESLEQRVQDLETTVADLSEAVNVLSRGLEQRPGQEPDEQRAARAARLAHEILIATER
jgi:uncharacterized protein (DUF2267 family)